MKILWDLFFSCLKVGLFTFGGGAAMLPLLQAEFINEFAPLTGKRIYLETNGTLTKSLEQIIDYIDIISMDFKINSCAKIIP